MEPPPPPALLPPPEPPVAAAAPPPLPRPRRRCDPPPPPHSPQVLSGLIVATGTARDRSNSAKHIRWLQLLPDDTTARPPLAAPDGESRLAGGWDASAVVHVELHDEWYDTPARQGDRANLVGSFPTTCGCGNSLHQRCTSLRRGDEGLLVLRPEHLITGTSLSVAVNCPRKVVIGKGGSDDGGASERMILGTMKHMVFEALLTRWMSDRAKADQRMQQQQQHAAIALHPAAANNEEEDAELLDSIMFRHSDKLLALNVNTSTLRTDLRNFCADSTKVVWAVAAASLRLYERARTATAAAANVRVVAHNEWRDQGDRGPRPSYILLLILITASDRAKRRDRSRGGAYVACIRSEGSD